MLGGEAQLHTAKARALCLHVEGGEAAALPEGWSEVFDEASQTT
jgi:hypothetical protein